jgi:endonuclease III related protein
MRARAGHQGWWPGDTPFEVCVGAILTQNTAWTNVQRAIANLKAARVLHPQPLYDLPESELARLLRPAGYFNVKARRLRAFLQALLGDAGGDLDRFLAGPTPKVRERLLAIHGIGPETADSILLYAGRHASFVIDAYTRRIFSRHGWWPAPARRAPASRAKTNSHADYHSLQQLCADALKQRRATGRLDYWRDFHAQLVLVGKDYCRPRDPRCHDCPLRPLLPGCGRPLIAG